VRRGEVKCEWLGWVVSGCQTLLSIQIQPITGCLPSPLCFRGGHVGQQGSNSLLDCPQEERVSAGEWPAEQRVPAKAALSHDAVDGAQ
jgi:hypothetical protein